jgi:hypothetical protein
MKRNKQSMGVEIRTQALKGVFNKRYYTKISSRYDYLKYPYLVFRSNFLTAGQYCGVKIQHNKHSYLWWHQREGKAKLRLWIKTYV